MIWIYVVVGVAVLGLVLLGVYVYVLYRKFAALASELGVAAERLEQALGVLDQIRIPEGLGERYDAAFERE